MNTSIKYVDWPTQPIHMMWTGWLSVINRTEAIGWTYSILEDWLIVMGLFISYWIFFCPRHNLSSKWRTGWLSRAYSSWSWHSCIFVFFDLLIDYWEVLDTTYPPNGGLADCPKLIPSVYLIRCWLDYSEVLATIYPSNGRGLIAQDWFGHF